MAVSRKRPKGARHYGSFGLGVLVMAVAPRAIGYQDLAALMARQPDVSQRARAHMMASPFGTIHAATFSFPQPVGTLIPETPLSGTEVRLASAGTLDPEITGSLPFDSSGMPMQLYRPRLDFPSVNRSLKGDLLVRRKREEPRPPETSRDLTPGRVKTVSFPRPADAAAAPAAPPAPEADAKADIKADSAGDGRPGARSDMRSGMPRGPGVLTPADLALQPAASATAKTDPSFESKPAAEIKPSAERKHSVESKPLVESKPSTESKPVVYALASVPPAGAVPLAKETPLPDTLDVGNAAERLGRLYFGNNPVGEAVGPIQPWPAEGELLIESLPANDPDLKRASIPPDFNFESPSAALPSAGETIAPKGEVTGAGKRPKTPAERLGLDIKQRAKAEKCLSEAVYFESRGEVKRGQIAVAQVVMNRVFSGKYPTSVCGVVYQNAHRKLACQFTFACDNVPDVVNEPEMWTQAKDIARDMLDGKLWLPEVGHSTHYHAYWVHPAWVNEMRRMYKIGVHSFYRPRAWGDGTDAPPLNQSQTPPKPQAQGDDAEKKAKL